MVVRFNDSINGRDIDGLACLMSDDHIFIDMEGGVFAGKQNCLHAWRDFFSAFPDYRNVFVSLTLQGNVVTVVGHSMCSEPALAGPALWTATIRDGEVAEWRVFADSTEVREQLGV